MYKFGAISKEKYLSIEKAWKRMSKEWPSWGTGATRPIPREGPGELSQGLSHPEGYPFEKPGKYRVKAVYNEFGMYIPRMVEENPKRLVRFNKSRVRIESRSSSSRCWPRVGVIFRSRVRQEGLRRLQGAPARRAVASPTENCSNSTRNRSCG